MYFRLILGGTIGGHISGKRASCEVSGLRVFSCRGLLGLSSWAAGLRSPSWPCLYDLLFPAGRVIVSRYNPGGSVRGKESVSLSRQSWFTSCLSFVVVDYRKVNGVQKKDLWWLLDIIPCAFSCLFLFFLVRVWILPFRSGAIRGGLVQALLNFLYSCWCFGFGYFR